MNNNKRYGRFTSSEIYKLIKIDAKGNFHAPAITYIEEKIIESRIESCLSSDAYSNPLAWGTFMELVVYSILGMEYQISSKETSLHPVHGEFWSGSKDLFTADPKTKKILSIAEIKCYQKKKFAQYSDCLRKKDISLFKSIFPQEYWQIVSNCCIDDCEIGEAIAYMPYVSEAEEIKNLAENYSGDDAWKQQENLLPRQAGRHHR